MSIKNRGNKKMIHAKASMKAKFNEEEDQKLKEIVLAHGACEWSKIAMALPGRTARQCRDRWVNYLNPLLCDKEWTEEEDNLLLEMYKEFGTHWKDLSLFFHGRSLNSVRNRVLKLERRNKSKARKKHGKILTELPESKNNVEIKEGDVLDNKLFDFKSLDGEFLGENSNFGFFEDWFVQNI